MSIQRTGTVERRAGLRAALGTAARRSRAGIIALAIVRNLRLQLRDAFGRIESFSGATHLPMTVSESVGYIGRVVDDYFHYGNLSREGIAGRRVLELGPGDNAGVALRFIAAGARCVTCIDRFDVVRDAEQQRQIYLLLRSQLPPGDRMRFDDAIDLRSGVRFNPDRLRWIVGTKAERLDKVLQEQSVDLIVSRSVLEEVQAIDRLFASLDRVLVPNGLMVHKIDLRDYGIFSSHGFHPLEFLTIPAPVYALIASGSDRPNRKRVDYYREKMIPLGYSTITFSTSAIGLGYSPVPDEIIPHPRSLRKGIDYDDGTLELIRIIRPRLRAPFRRLRDEDLLVGGIFLVLQKPRT